MHEGVGRRCGRANLLSDGEKFGRNLGAKLPFYRPNIGT